MVPLGASFARVVGAARLEPALGGTESGTRVQFERLGYFCADADGSTGKPVFNRTVTLRDTWGKIQKKAR